jgi:hypothetical protein
MALNSFDGSAHMLVRRWLIVRSAFAGIFQARVEMKTALVREHSRVVSPA